MKILIIIDDYIPKSYKAAALMMHDLAKYFAQNKHEVCVISPNGSNLKNQYLNIDNVKICLFKSYKIKNVNYLTRLINETLLSFNAVVRLKSELEEKRDLIIYYSPSIFWGPLVWFLKRKWLNSKSFLILRDIFPQWAIDSNIIKKRSLITYYFKYFENILYKFANKIVVQSPGNLKYFYNNYPNYKAKIDVLYNWISPNKLDVKIDYREKYNLKDKFILFFGGNIGKAQDIRNLLRLAINLQYKKEIHFLFVGTGDEVIHISEYQKKYNLKNISYYPQVPQNEYFEILSSCDVGLFSLNKFHNTQNFPGKILGYLLYNKPIVGSVNPNNDLKEIFEEYKSGLISINGEDEIFKKNVLKIYNDLKFRKNVIDNGKKMLNELFSVEKVYSYIIDFYQKK